MKHEQEHCENKYSFSHLFIQQTSHDFLPGVWCLNSTWLTEIKKQKQKQTKNRSVSILKELIGGEEEPADPRLHTGSHRMP